MLQLAASIVPFLHAIIFNGLKFLGVLANFRRQRVIALGTTLSPGKLLGPSNPNSCGCESLVGFLSVSDSHAEERGFFVK